QVYEWIGTFSPYKRARVYFVVRVVLSWDGSFYFSLPSSLVEAGEPVCNFIFQSNTCFLQIKTAKTWLMLLALRRQPPPKSQYAPLG
ncbi:hypothetical protein, partial [Paenibacillus farraposensis]|uniref:hypothetical protein n=1 Tax=Paenibacillus farraposensis TaxID=2807095 RepID=UPI001E2C99BC